MRKSCAGSKRLRRNSRTRRNDAKSVRVIPESIDPMVRSGLFRILQPSRVHGYEMDFRTFADAATRVSEACPSSGWVLT